ncbi:MAG: Outer membrane protein-like protein [Cytophagales bacterium]|nr:MAG: Outer membrane protein-like protein [Cytophagales bacterium]
MVMSEAVTHGLKNYQTIEAKRNYYRASAALKQNTKNEYLPNLIGSIQQDYGTVNGQYGPLGAVGLPGAGAGLAVASAGPVSGLQSWNAAFGALYLANVNWEFFTFGRVRSKIKMSGAQANRDSADLTQEQFVHGIRVAGAYLSLLTAQRLIVVAQSNLRRAVVVQKTIKARALTGLNPGVDSSLANADVSRAKLLLIQAINTEQQNRNVLAQYLKLAPDPFLLDTTFFERVPADFKTSTEIDNNPQVQFYKSRIRFSDQMALFLKRSALPSTNFFSIIQTRASGFNYNYSPLAPQNYSSSYADGITPTRSNFLLGVALSWNVMNLTKIRQQVNAQHFLSAAYQNEYDLISTQLKDQLILADQKIENCLLSLKEVPLQYKAASDAFVQKTTLYKNGLATIVELQQAEYSLTQAETDLNVAYINVWQALLLKSAASGDFDLFITQAR